LIAGLTSHKTAEVAAKEVCSASCYDAPENIFVLAIVVAELNFSETSKRHLANESRSGLVCPPSDISQILAPIAFENWAFRCLWSTAEGIGALEPYGNLRL
jgi:hypothetical protein